MLTSLSLQNFKSWKQIGGMRFAPITGLFGPNSSGKTSILQFLLMLKETAQATDRQQVLDFGVFGRQLHFGAFRDIIYGHVKRGRLDWTLAFDLPQPLIIKDPDSDGSTLFEDDKLLFRARVQEEPDGGLVVRRINYTFAGHDFGLEQRRKEEQPAAHGVKPAKGSYRLVERGSGPFQVKHAPGRSGQLPRPVKCYGFPDEVFSSFQNVGFLADLQLALEKQLAALYYLEPLRATPWLLYYPWGHERPADVGTSGNEVIEAIISSRQRSERISQGEGCPSKTLEECIADWLRRLGLLHSFQVRAVSGKDVPFQVLVRKTARSTQVSLTDVGFGVSQVLPVIALCYYVPEGSTIILEQPEVHLHPAVQAGLADVFIDAMRVRKIQIIVESHSEHLLRRLQRRIAEHQSLSNEDVALYFCRFEGKESKLDPLDVDPYGNIKNWPNGFFGNEFDEMAEMTLAAMKRKREESEKP